MKIALLAVALIIFTTPALARIGETPAQCAARYGAAISKGGNEATFSKAGLTVFARFNASGVCDLISFRKIADFEDVTDAEFQALRAANGGGEEWIENGNRFVTGSGMVAGHNDRTVVIGTAAGGVRFVADIEARERENLDGF